MTPKDLLIVIALKEESNGLLESRNLDVLYTGVGKVNATYHLTKELEKRRYNNVLPKRIINFGTAGSNVFKEGELVASFSFIQRDMDTSPLGFEKGQTPFESEPMIISHPIVQTALKTGCCGSGDNFETQLKSKSIDLVDMEAYALAKVCYKESLPFMSIKYISDGANEKSATTWEQNVTQGAAAFLSWYDKYNKWL